MFIVSILKVSEVLGMGSNGYCREAEYRGHVVNPKTHCCSLCGLMQNAWLDIDKDCPKHIPAPPWSATFGNAPTPNRGFCPGNGTHNMSKMKLLDDLSTYTCTAIQVGFGCVGITASKATGNDLYTCSHCHQEFTAKCIHGMF